MCLAYLYRKICYSDSREIIEEVPTLFYLLMLRKSLLGIKIIGLNFIRVLILCAFGLTTALNLCVRGVTYLESLVVIIKQAARYF